MASWTAAEEQFLIENYPSKGKIFCCETLNRSDSAVKSKACKLGLKLIEIKNTKTHDQYENELFEKEIDYFPIEQYIDSKTPILHQCLNDHTWYSSPNSILSNRGCPYCSRKIKKTNSHYISELPKEYIILEDYINNYTPIVHKHTICGHEWLVRPYSILRGTRCPNCSGGNINSTLPAILYHVSFTYKNNTYYKIGITGREEVHFRFTSDWAKYNMEVIWQIRLPYGKMAKVLERNLLKNFKHLKINTGLLMSGNTETLFEEIECPV